MKHIIRLFAKIISSFVKDKDKKKHVYQSIAEFRPCDTFAVKKFNKTKTRNNSVLLVETNGCHGEVVSAYFKYFKDLGYNVDIIMHTFIYNEHHFARHDISDVNIFHCRTTAMHKMFQSPKMKDYKAIIVMTPMNYTFETQPVLSLFPELKQYKNLYLIVHNVFDADTYLSDFNQKHILGVGDKLKKYPRFNPILFGDLKKQNKKHKPTTFITVGGITKQRKNHDLLLKAMEVLLDKGYKFNVVIIGGGKKIKNISKKIRPFLKTPGRQVSEKMFRYMENSDFFLTLWDKNVKDHLKYGKNHISGSSQLIYAFNKIPIVQKEFTKFYDFDDKNAIVYEDDNLAAAMERAILMKDAEYGKIYKELDKLSKSVYQESKKNLKSMIK